MSANDGWEPVGPVQQAWENGGRQYYEQRRRQEERQEQRLTSVIDYAGQMDVCTPVRRLYATSPGYTLREQEHLVRSGQLDGGLQPPAGWREPQLAAAQPAAQPVRRPAARSWQFAAQLEEWRPPAAAQPEPQPIVYAQYDPAFDPDLQPQPVRSAVELKPPPGPVEVPVKTEEAEEEQLVVTPAGFRFAARFEHLEIKR